MLQSFTPPPLARRLQVAYRQAPDKITSYLSWYPTQNLLGLSSIICLYCAACTVIFYVEVSADHDDVTGAGGRSPLN